MSVYSLLSGKNVEKGLVEIFLVHGSGYYEIALNGEIVESVHKNRNLGQILLRPSFIKQCVKSLGVSEDELVYVLIDFESYADGALQLVGDDYDSNDFEEYEQYEDLVKTHGPKPVQKHYIPYYKDLAIGVEQMEDINF